MIYSKIKGEITINIEVKYVKLKRKHSRYDDKSYIIYIDVVKLIDGNFIKSACLHVSVENLYKLTSRQSQELQMHTYTSLPDDILDVLSTSEIADIIKKLIIEYGKENLLLPFVPYVQEEKYYDNLSLKDKLDTIKIPYFDLKYDIFDDKVEVLVDNFNKIYNINNFLDPLLADLREYLFNLPSKRKMSIIKTEILENKLGNNE